MKLVLVLKEDFDICINKAEIAYLQKIGKQE